MTERTLTIWRRIRLVAITGAGLSGGVVIGRTFLTAAEAMNVPALRAQVAERNRLDDARYEGMTRMVADLQSQLASVIDNQQAEIRLLCDLTMPRSQRLAHVRCGS
jgi:hypothetical protein